LVCMLCSRRSISAVMLQLSHPCNADETTSAKHIILDFRDNRLPTKIPFLNRPNAQLHAQGAGEHGVLGNTCKDGRREMSVRSVGGLMSGSTNHHGLLLGKYKSIYTNDEATGLAGQVAPLARSIINLATPGLAGP
jgi:hypothetical protein